MYKTIRTIHLLVASFSLPFLLMYALSAVQMSHTTWFTLRPAVTEQQLALSPGAGDAREIAREVVSRVPAARGELTNVRQTPRGSAFRLVVPGTVNDVDYDRATGAVKIKTSVAGFMGMLNRLHHAAGLHHETPALNAWGAAVAIVSLGLLLLGATGIYMWFTRRPERLIGCVLVALNLVVAAVLLFAMRRHGP